ncbi:hypothetical protein [Paludisphaera soli]|uniref:hypothetical protein n=1 Tax=Paludisphaera soli TaxID=2712865 RepID=UPI0013ED4224|nr:hypothetical protein [Paludisphaera soli]
MAERTARSEAPEPGGVVLEWLLDSDPSIRWQVLRDLTGEPPEVVAAERARVASEGWGARLLDLQAADGQWGGGVYFPYWTATTDTLALLRELGVDPDCDRARRAAGLVRDRVTWGEEFGDAPFFEGEVEPCINGRVLALGAYFGEPSDRLVDRLLGEQLDDGGWNCEAPASKRSSFHSTICVLEGLLEYEKARGPATAVADASARGREYLLERGLFRRRSTGAVIDADWARFSFPTRWAYDVLRGLDYLRAAGVEPDRRIAEAVALVVRKRDDSGRWPLENPHPGEVHFAMEAADEPSRWNTLRALRVLDWASDGAW